MLTADLVRATLRQGVIRPRWIDPDDAELRHGVEGLIAAFQARLGRQVHALDDAVAELTVAHADPILWRGFAKLLYDRTTTAARSAVAPAMIRAHVFAEAGRRWPIGPTSRTEALAAAAEALGISVEAVEAGLYADRSSEQWIELFDPPTAEVLLADYNLALAQASLFRAHEVRVELEGIDAKRARAVLRELKFRRLLARVEATAKGWKLTLDGPMSLFKQTSRYGLQLALFLPALVRCGAGSDAGEASGKAAWRLEADVAWGKAARPATLKLSNEAPLVVRGHHGDEGTWVSAEEEHFVKSFAALDGPWRLSSAATMIDLDGRDVLLPDMVMRHEDGREVLIELVWAWRRQGFKKRIELLKAAGPANLIVAWAERGGHDADAQKHLEEVIGLPGLLRFKGVIPPKKVVELAERLAVAAPAKAAKRKAVPASRGPSGRARRD